MESWKLKIVIKLSVVKPAIHWKIYERSEFNHFPFSIFNFPFLKREKEREDIDEREREIFTLTLTLTLTFTLCLANLAIGLK